MANELELVRPEDIAALADELGASTNDLQGGGGYLPALKVNMDDDSDEDGAPRLKGKLFLQSDQFPPVYADTASVVIRPLTHVYQWTKYDKTLKKTVNRTRLIASFREEARDELGTLRCGKPPSKEIRGDDALKKQYEDITTYRRIQALVSYTGIGKDGTKQVVEPTLASISLKGANFSPFQDEFIDEMPEGSYLWDFETGVTLSREKNGTVTYYVMHFTPKFEKKVPLSMDVYKTLQGLRDRINEINREVDEKYYKALANASSTDKAAEALKSVGGLAKDLDDDIPF